MRMFKVGDIVKCDFDDSQSFIVRWPLHIDGNAWDDLYRKMKMSGRHHLVTHISFTMDHQLILLKDATTAPLKGWWISDLFVLVSTNFTLSEIDD